MNAASIRISNSAVKATPVRPSVGGSDELSQKTQQMQSRLQTEPSAAQKRRAESGRQPTLNQLENQQYSNMVQQQSTNQIGISASVPCVPGRTQRVLINKRQAAKSTTTAARLFKKPLPAAGHEQSQSSNTFSSFVNNSKSYQVPPFNSKELRFDGKLELKEYFNKDAGPGTYSETASTIESSLNSEMQKLQHFDGKTQIMRTFNNKAKRFVPATDMLTTDPKINVAPGQYDPMRPQEHKQAPRMDYKGDFSLPFNENNPLNYVKPITVNIYFKQKMPGVGQYDPHPIQGNAKGGREVFVSKTERGIIDKITAKALLAKPAPGQYDPQDGFDAKWREQDQGTHQFQDKIQKQIVPVNLYDPHAAPEDDKNKHPDAYTYKIKRDFDAPRFTEEFEPRLDYVPGGGKIYNETNLDRFGLPIRPMKPINIVPGPGEYETMEPVYDVLGPKPAIAKGGYIPEAQISRVEPNNPNVPGPAFYNASKEPKKISFLFNPSEKWVE